MAIVSVANDLWVRTALLPAGVGSFYVGFECSQPVSMLGASVVRVAGVLQAVAGSGFELYGALDGSNDLSTWVAVVVSGDLIAATPSPPHKFSFAPATPVAFPYAYARVRWMLKPVSGALLADWGVLLSATLTNGLR